jgi:hypothetical protein
MTCPKCSGPLAMLFTSTYCPKCEAKDPALDKTVGPIQCAQLDGTLFVGSDGELWIWKSGVAIRITQDSIHGPVVGFAVLDDCNGMGMTLSVLRARPGDIYVSRILHFGMYGMLHNASPRQWSKPVTVERI